MNPVYTQTIIAVVWDFDKTLIPGYMQRPLFEHFTVDESKFWGEVNQQEEIYRHQGCEQVSDVLAYLNHVILYARNGRFKGLNNQLLHDLGEQLIFYPGLPDFFAQLKNKVADNLRWKEHDIVLEHYIVSTGFTRTIRGSAIAPHVDGVWGCEFLENQADEPILDQVGYVLDHTTKTRAVFEINKGVNKNAIDVNAAFPENERRIPFNNMIYIADGPSDVPVFSVVKKMGGRTYGVYNPEQEKEFLQIKKLQDQGRVQSFGPADYREGSQTWMWLWSSVNDIANRIVTERERSLGEKVGDAPRHLND